MTSPQAISLLSVAKQTGRAPSQIAGIDCAYCAYCFDEALFSREWAQNVKQLRERDQEERMKRLHKRVGLRAV